MKLENNEKGSIVFGIILGALFVLALVLYVGLKKAEAPKEDTIIVDQSILTEDNSSDMEEQTQQNQNITTTSDGLVIEVLQEGSGAVAENGMKTTVHYTGTFESGEKFDSSLDRGTPFTFLLGAGQVIKGWDEGVLGMKVGEKRKLTVPYTLGYGADGYGPIPPKATLIFEVELLGVM